MSRFDYDDDSEQPAHWWQQRVERDFKSGRGKRNIQRVIDAMDAMPRHELTEGSFTDTTWDDEDNPTVHVCALGALAALEEVQSSKKPTTWDMAAEWLPTFEGDAWSTADYAQKQLGMSYALAMRIAEVNDEVLSDVSDGERWVRMRAWLVSQLADPDPWRNASRMVTA